MDQETQERYAENGKVMLGTSILLFLTILLLIFLHTYRPSCFRRRRHRIRRVWAISATALSDIRLHPSVLTFLPAFTYSSDTQPSLEDCTVCLSEFADGDEGRVLPNCNHIFHSHCIDAWFRSHSNCPLCRTPVQKRAEPDQSERLASSSVEPGPPGLSSFPAPIGCPRKSLDLELVGIIVELEDRRRRESDPESGRVPPDNLTPPCV